MKKFKELQVVIGSDKQAIAEFNLIKTHCNGTLFTFSEEVERLYHQDDKMLHILARVQGVPEAIILVFISDGNIKVINIVPNGNDVSCLTKEQYNHILDNFAENIIRPLLGSRYEIIITSDDIQMENIIPKSFQSLMRFVNCPGKESPFSHPMDRERWCEFICTLFSNNEYLSSGDLEQWLLEDLHREQKLVCTIIEKYEDATELLEYYDRNYN